MNEASPKNVTPEAKVNNAARIGRPRKHRPSEAPEYRVLGYMRTRCYNTNRGDYKWYGGKGIIVCERWMNGADGMTDIECFIHDMGKRPGPEFTIDRIDGDGNYEPSNCRWIKIDEQQRNKSSNRNIEFRGETLCMAAMARKYGIPFSALRERLELKWSLEKALLTPSIPIKKIGQLEYNGECKSITQWARQYGLKYHTLLLRIKAGWGMQRALLEPLVKRNSHVLAPVQPELVSPSCPQQLPLTYPLDH